MTNETVTQQDNHKIYSAPPAPVSKEGIEFERLTNNLIEAFAARDKFLVKTNLERSLLDNQDEDNHAAIENLFDKGCFSGDDYRYFGVADDLNRVVDDIVRPSCGSSVNELSVFIVEGDTVTSASEVPEGIGAYVFGLFIAEDDESNNVAVIFYTPVAEESKTYDQKFQHTYE